MFVEKSPEFVARANAEAILASQMFWLGVALYEAAWEAHFQDVLDAADELVSKAIKSRFADNFVPEAVENRGNAHRRVAQARANIEAQIAHWIC